MGEKKTPRQKLSDFSYKPGNPSQIEVFAKWRESKVLILTGPAGTGKTSCATAGAIGDIIHGKAERVYLCRPTVTIQEDLGFLPGSLNEKILPWMGSFSDVLGDMSHKKLEEILDIVEFIPVGMIRGRTIKNGTLICDEAQNLTYQQLKAILTRLGKNSKIILCGDPDQSDLNNNSNSDLNPLTEVSNKLQYLKEASIIRFTMKDQMRDEFVNEVINCLK